MKSSNPSNLSFRYGGIRPGCVALGLIAFQVTTASAAAALSPSIDLLGSYFPAWLPCIVAGVILTIVARLLFIAWKLDTYLFPGLIVYPCLAAVFAMAVWLIFFGANL
jgi:hypothetical protein